MTCGVSTPAKAKTPTFARPVTIDTVASVAITAAPSSPTAIMTDSKIMPDPVVPPIKRPQTAAPAIKPFAPS
jgi:hypothetical protein